MPTRVLWLTKGLGPGGTERLVVEMARARDETRVEPTVAYVLPWKDHLAGELEAAGVRTVCLSTRMPRMPRWPLRLRRLVADGGFDIVHSHSPAPAVVLRLAAWTVRPTLRPVLVTTEHNTWRSLRRATRWANRLTSRADAATFAVTEEVRASVHGAAARRVEVLVHGVDLDRIAALADGDPSAVRASLGLGPSDVVIGTVANLRPQKDYPTLLAAARLLVDRGVSFRLVAVGQGPLERDIAARRDGLGLGDHVVLAGFRPDAVAVMAACDVFVLASAWEGLPVGAMEAAALGLPIVATAVGGVAEHFAPGDAVLVPPGDPEALAGALEQLVADDRRRAQLSAAARSAATRFDVHRLMDTLTERYEHFAGPPAMSVPTLAQPRRLAALPDIRPANEGDRDQILSLLDVSLGWAGDARYHELFAWKHERNPFGSSLAWVAVAGGRVVAVRLFMRWEFRRGGSTLRAVRAVDTATHPDHQGRGLFTALTEHALEACRAEGVAFVFNTPNARSRPGYLSMGWRDVGRPAVAGRPAGPRHVATIAHSRVPAEHWSVPIDVGTDLASWLEGSGSWPPPAPVSSTDRTLRTASDERVARWRYGLADLHYRVVDGEGAAIVVRLRRRGASRELVVAEHLGDLDRADSLVAETLRQVDATHALRLGRANLRRGFVPLPGAGPMLTWRAVCDQGPPPLPNWDLRLGDVELL